MPLINTSVPNLIQGVSQQPDAVRFDGQCEEQENALSSVVDGLKKRPNTRHIARLITSAIASDSFVHFINRDDDEKYVVIVDNDTETLKAWNLDGTPCTINGSNIYSHNISGSYLGAENPNKDLKALTIADGTFLVNTKATVGLGSDTSPDLDKEALVFIKQGDYDKTYNLNLKGSFASGGASGTTASATITMVPSGGATMQVGSVNIDQNNAGTLYEAGLTTTFSIPPDHQSNNNWKLVALADAVFQIAVDSNGAITGVTVLNGGSYQYKYTQGWSTSYRTSTFTESTTVSAPTGTGSSTDVDVAAVSLGNSSAANADTVNIMGRVRSAFQTSFPINNNANDDFTTHQEGNLLVLTRANNKTDFEISGSDGLGGAGIGVVYKEVSSISDLPSFAKNNFRVKVTGDAELNQDDYYVKFKTNGGQAYGEGAWQEDIAPNIRLGLDSATLPLILLNTAPNTFTLSAMDVKDRTVGDDNSNPLPSFAAQTIQNLFFYRNRLGFLSNENVILSESGLGGPNVQGTLEYNFLRTTVTTTLDSDPIDVSVASSRVTNLLAAKGFQENLVLFSENGQFVLKGGDVLTPRTVSITPITNFDVESAVDPLPLGSYLYFPFNRGNFTGLREFAVNATSDTYDSVDVTEHVPSYVPSNIIDMAGTTTEDTIALLSGDETNALYIYKYFWSGNRKVLSSFSKFTFGDDIRGIEFIDSTLYLVTVDSEANTHLLSLPIESGLTDIDHNGNTAGFLTLLDKRVRASITAGSSLVSFEQPNGSYSSANADQPYTYFNGTIPSGGATLTEVFIDADGNSHALKYQNIGSGGQVMLSSGNASSTKYGYVGIPYTMKYKFSTQVFKAQSGNSASPSSASAMQVRNGSVFFDKTHTFDVKVTPDGRSTFTETFSADDRPDSETLGNRKFAEGFFRFPVHSKAKNVDIVIENDSPFDSKFNSAEFESFVHPRSKRYG